MSSFQGLYNIRPYKEADKNFILASFLKGLYYGNKYYNMIDKRIFMDNYKIVANGLLTSPNVTIKVACLPEDSDVILGYSILSKDNKRIVWVFIKTVWRRKGLGKSLIPVNPESYMHFTDVGLELVKKLPNCIFNPF